MRVISKGHRALETGREKLSYPPLTLMAGIFFLGLFPLLLSLHVQTASATVVTVGSPAFQDVEKGYKGYDGDDQYIGGTATDGGPGGPGGFARIYTSDDSQTTNSIAVYVASIGGNGGKGGDSYGIYNTGGDGGDGGDAWHAETYGLHNITTYGDNSVGIFVMSQAGNGGDGGDGTGLYGEGGSGGAPGSGGAALAENYGSISTSGQQSHGIFAQSTGGMGGDGGNGSGIWGGGGSGSAAGSGGDASVHNEGNIDTAGSSSNGIFAQSVGGYGGDGGAGSGLAGYGGSAGSSGGGGAVTAENIGGKISTHADYSNGILAQSIGGGGGSAGSGSGLVGLGGDGSAGGGGGSVTVNLGKNQNGSAATIHTYGAYSNGIYAQSIGGGGGDGGRGAGLVGIGGSGDAAGDGGAVNVNSSTGLSGATTISIITEGPYSNAILAQSIGGGGGNAGGGGGLVSIGGSGDKGGNGGSVSVNTDNTSLSATGQTSSGIFAQSVGGAGSGGLGSTVDLTNAASISTQGTNSDGILAQSVGGGGGNGGFSVSGALALNPGGSAAGTFSLGGSGGDGGSSDKVSVTNTGALIVTAGDNSIGIEAQSIGGGGGNGGFSVGGGLSGLGDLNLSFGGSGGDGGKSSDVSVSSVGAIETSGAASQGILAQSVGGGGGNGGFSVGAGISGAAQLAFSFGGKGGDGNTSGSVTVTDTGTAIVTSGQVSAGIQAQSIAGGGGNGGFSVAAGLSSSAGVSVAVGGSGGSGANAGTVEVTSGSSIGTSGEESPGVLAQSIGGGGGNGGIVVGGDLTTGGSVNVLIGASGAGAGNGGNVTVTKTGNVIETSGQRSAGILAQSIGGGGGAGSLAIGGTLSALSAGFSIGGQGGAGGDGGDVQVTNQSGSIIWTKGDLSGGIYAQSIGGGGGNGGGAYSGLSSGFSTSVGGSGSSGGDGGAVTVDNFGVIETDGAGSQAVFAQSVGGGGGNGAFAGSFGANITAAPNVTVSVGGSGGSGGNGGNVTVNNNASGSIITNGANSTAIFAQSVGGGGGNGCLSFGTSVTPGVTASVAIGGSGGNGGDGGDVTVTNAGAVQINADNSVGIMAQSVGGGGGTAGSALSAALVPVFIGGQNGVVGKGGDVTVTNTGSIYIYGSNSIGIFAQSVGGGGGLVKPGGGASSVTSQAGGSGNGGTVTIDNSAGEIKVTGDNSIAMFTQSVGGGGGAVGASAASPGQVGAFMFSGSAGGLGAADTTMVNQTGNLIATGSNSVALAVQSSAPDGNGDITVNIKNGSSPSLIVGGTGQGAGVNILDGANNQLNNYGTITSVLGVDGFAIRGGAGDDHVYNYGYSSGINYEYGFIFGSVDLGAGANSFNNGQNAVFESGATVNLGGGALTNEGLLRPGGWNKLFTTNITGNFTQTATGVYGADLDLKNLTADRINITGTAAVSGKIVVNLINPTTYAANALPGLHKITLLHTVGDLTHDGLTLVAPNTAVAGYWLTYQEDPTIDLNSKIDFSPSNLTPNQHSVGNAINRIQLAQVPAFQSIATALFFQPTVAGLGAIYDSLSGEGVAAAEQTGFQANDWFLTAIAHRTAYWASGDPNNPVGRALSGDKDLLYARETPGDPPSRAVGTLPKATRNWRLWTSGYGGVSSYNGGADAGSVPANLNGAGFAIGIDYQVAPHILVGIAGGSGFFSFDVPGRETSGGVKPWHLAGYGATRQGRFYALGALAYNHFEIDEKRHVAIPGVTYNSVGGGYQIAGFDEKPSGKFGADSVSGYFEAGYNARIKQFTVTPFAALEFGVLQMNGFRESGNLGLSYAGRTVSSLPTQVGVQVKHDATLAWGVTLTTQVRAAWKHELEPERSVKASFNVAPGFDFVVQGAQPPRDSLRSGVGFNLSLGRSASLSANFDSDYSKAGHSFSGTGGLRFTW